MVSSASFSFSESTPCCSGELSRHSFVGQYDGGGTPAVLVDAVTREPTVGGRKRRESSRLAVQPFAHLGTIGEYAGKDFDRDLAPKTRVTCAIYLAHATLAERRNDLVRT